MSSAIGTVYPTPARTLAVAWCVGVLGLTSCHRAPPAPDSNAARHEDAQKTGEGVALTAEQSQKMGIATQPAESIGYRAETAGFGTVISHDTIAVAVAELTTAQAAARQSRAARERAERLSGTPGALSADAVDSAARQSATDAAALALAQQRLSTIVGTGVPGGIAANGALLQDLASGKIKLLRATFPLGALKGSTPASLRAARLDTLSPDAAHPSQGWNLISVWAAPADASLPGRSFFALLEQSDAGEGERLLVWAPGSEASQQGVAVPAAALVVSEGKYWCYVETQPGVYRRREIPTDRPIANGYFVTDVIATGDRLVTAAAGLLLARESNPSSEAD